MSSGIIQASKVCLGRSLWFSVKNWITQWAKKRRRAAISYDIKYGVVVGGFWPGGPWVSEPKRLFLKENLHTEDEEKGWEKKRETDSGGGREENKGSLSELQLYWHHQSETQVGEFPCFCHLIPALRAPKWLTFPVFSCADIRFSQSETMPAHSVLSTSLLFSYFEDSLLRSKHLPLTSFSSHWLLH